MFFWVKPLHPNPLYNFATSYQLFATHHQLASLKEHGLSFFKLALW